MVAVVGTVMMAGETAEVVTAVVVTAMGHQEATLAVTMEVVVLLVARMGPAMPVVVLAELEVTVVVPAALVVRPDIERGRECSCICRTRSIGSTRRFRWRCSRGLPMGQRCGPSTPRGRSSTA